jgi:hypothetical protein
MYLKVMSDENLHDRNSAKCYRLIECKEVSFYRTQNGNSFANVDGEQVTLWGNAYILNSNGKTIDSMECCALPSMVPTVTPEGVHA